MYIGFKVNVTSVNVTSNNKITKIKITTIINKKKNLNLASQIASCVSSCVLRQSCKIMMSDARRNFPDF